MGEHDRQESEHEVRVASIALQQARTRFRELPADLPAPLDDSVLAVERVHTARAPLDHLVNAHRVRAGESLERLFDLMIDEANHQVVAYPHSLYALIRASVESAATGLWLIQSSKKSDRVFRALQLEYRNAMDRLRFTELIAPRDIVAAERDHAKQVQDRLNELKNTLPPLRQRMLGQPPKYTEILRSVSERDRRTGHFDLNSPLVVWKAASAFIHGSDDVSRSLSDIRQLTPSSGGSATYEVTPKMMILAGSASVCVDLLAKLHERYTYLHDHDYAGRSVA